MAVLRLRLDENIRWQLKARCVDYDPEIFFPPQGGDGRMAKAICAGCPVERECAEFATKHRINWGIWGGTDERERRLLRKELDGDVPAVAQTSL